MSRLRGPDQRRILERIYERLAGDPGAEATQAGGQGAEDFLDTLMREIEICSTRHVHQPEEIEDLIAAVFEPLLDVSASQGVGQGGAAQALQSLRTILSGNWHLPFRPYSYGLTEPQEGSPDYGSTSQKWTAQAEQRRMRVSVRAVSMPGELPKFRGVVLRRGAEASEILLAGSAQAQGLVVASVGHFANGIPSFMTVQEALDFVHSRSVGKVVEASPDISEQEAARDEHLEMLLATIGSEAGAAALAIRCRLLEQALRKSRECAIRQADQADARHANFVDLVRGTDLAKPYFDIYANHTRASGDPEGVRALKRAQMRVTLLEERLLELSKSKPDERCELGPT